MKVFLLIFFIFSPQYGSSNTEIEFLSHRDCTEAGNDMEIRYRKIYDDSVTLTWVCKKPYIVVLDEHVDNQVEPEDE